MTIKWSFSYNFFVKFHGEKKWESQHDRVISKSVFNNVCYKGAALYMLDYISSFARKPVIRILDQVRSSNKPAQLHRLLEP